MIRGCRRKMRRPTCAAGTRHARLGMRSRIPGLSGSVLVVLAGCGGSPSEPVVKVSCSDLYTIRPTSPWQTIRIVRGDRAHVSVALLDVPRERYAHCPDITSDGFRWTIVDTTVARIVNVWNEIATIHAVEYGETELRAYYRNHSNFWKSRRLRVVGIPHADGHPNADAFGGGPGPGAAPR